MNAPFNKPENRVAKAATIEGVKRINEALAKAGSKNHIVLHEPSDQVAAGDIRHSMIVMVEDPVSSGVIGYGPSVANPLTGEIVSARTVMYLGTSKRSSSVPMMRL
jgi:hypothetical protein